MAKALMVACGNNAGLGNGNEFNLFGFNNTMSSTEANNQASCTEDATFTGLRANVTGGNSGTATFAFRDAGGAGQQTFNISGTGVGEDTTNSDALTAGDLFNGAYTDTGSNSTIAWIAGNVEFASGHGWFQGAAAFGGSVYDAASTTNFIALAGALLGDGNSSEDEAAWKCRGADVFEAFQLNVLTNARTNNSVFKNRVNKADGSGTITYATLETGIKTATGLADAIGDGQVACVSITLGTGVEDLVLASVTATLKSSTTKQDIFACNVNGIARAASATEHYAPIGGTIPTLTNLTEAQARIKPGYAGTASNIRCYLSANTYGGDGTLKLYQNGSAVITLTITAGGGAAWYENTVNTVTFDADDEFSLAWDEGTSGSITIEMMGLTLAPTVAGGTILPQMLQHDHFGGFAL